jgi:hypothetical protein
LDELWLDAPKGLYEGEMWRRIGFDTCCPRGWSKAAVPEGVAIGKVSGVAYGYWGIKGC